MKQPVICLVGTNHRYADQQLRERLAFEEEKLGRYLKELKVLSEAKEIMILSTCNRVEVLAVSDKPIEDRIIRFLADYSGVPVDKLEEVLYVKRDMEAVKHIFRVASSLDSMVIGEPQIMGQLKEAYKWSVEFMTSGAVINRIMRRAFHAAKVVKSETQIAKGAVSIPYAALIKSKEILGSLEGKKVLSIGVGEMNRLACEHFHEAGAAIAYVANRTRSNAEALAKQYSARLISLEDVPVALKDVDVVVTATSSRQPVITKDMIPENRPLIIDMAVPRDTQRGVEGLTSVVLIDDLKGIVDDALKFRKKEALKAEQIIERELETYREYVASLDYDQVVKKLRLRAEQIRQRELERFKKSYSSKVDDELLEGVDKLTRALLNKVLHEPTVNIKLFMDHPEGDMYIELLKRIFKIEHSKKDVKCFFSENS